MRLTWLSHSCFLIETGPWRLITDPFLTGNPKAAQRAEGVRATHVLCSHAHEDHLGDTVKIARANGATVIAPYELAEYIRSQGVEQVEDPMPGGWTTTSFGGVLTVPAIHSCALEQSGGRNLPLGIAVGYVLELSAATEGRVKRVYFAGDTALYSDMRLFARPRIDLALLPIGDHYTMGPEQAVRALEYLCPAVMVPMHYGTFEKMRGDPREFEMKAREAGHAVRVLAIGESVEM
jgi:L-ascorbate metabolism protein UlaG (beta-lactamase superfamily)